MRIPQLVGERFASFAFKVKVATFETLVLVVRHNFYVKSEYSVSGLHCTFFLRFTAVWWLVTKSLPTNRRL